MAGDLISAVQHTITRYRMLKKGDRVLISVSGGPDSVFLLHALARIAPEYHLGIEVFHLDHVTRKGQSKKDALFVKELCTRLGLGFTLRREEASKLAQERSVSFQQAARDLRLKFLEETALSKGCSRIAVGHNADDSVETVFLNLVRGCGVRGLGGIKPVWGNIIRPLIHTWRKDILNFLDSEGISYCLDKTNVENEYFRNRIRNRLIPYMEENISPNIKNNISRMAEVARLEDDFMGRQAKEVIEKQAEIITKDSQELVIILEADNFNNLHTALQRRVIIEAIGLLRGHVQDISFKNIEQVLALASRQGESRRMQPCRKVLISRQKDRILFINLAYADSLPRKYRAIFEHKPLLYRLDKVDGSIKHLEGFGINIKARLMDKPEKKLYRSAKGFEAFMDYDKIRFPVKIRNWERGDRFFPLGQVHERKLQDFFTDLKIPGYLRSMVPIFEDREKIIWVGGYRIDERVKIGSGSNKALYIRIL